MWFSWRLKKVLAALTFALTCTPIFAQTSESIRPDRPGQAIVPYAVGKGFLQLQSGLDLYESKSGHEETDGNAFNNVIRYGLIETFELNMLVNYQRRKEIDDFQLGLRYNLIQRPDGLLPALGLQARVRTPFVATSHRPKRFAPVLFLSSQHVLTDSLSWTNNLGLSYDGVVTSPATHFVSNLSLTLSPRWATFVEMYGDRQDARGRFYADGGFAFLPQNDLQLDLSFGGGRNHGVSDRFVSVGLSWRLPTSPPGS